MRLKNRHHLRSNEIEQLKNNITLKFGAEFTNKIFFKNSKIEVAEIEDFFLIYIVDGEFLIIKDEGILIPSIKAILNGQLDLLKIIVDMGAIKYVINGADIMKPGIVHIDNEIKEGTYVKIIEETHHKCLAVGLSLFDSKTMKKMKNGKVIKNIHFINDKIWNFLENALKI